MFKLNLMGWKMKGSENDVSPSFSKSNRTWNILKTLKLITCHWPPNHIFLYWPPNIRFISRATKLGTFHWPPSKMLSHWLPHIRFISRSTKLGTFPCPLSWGLPSLPSFLFYLKVWIWIICFFIFGCDFWFESLKTCSYNFLWEEKND
jgi:hypothetical protein